MAVKTFDYWQKQEKPLFPDLEWNFPEQKTGSISVIGGNLQNFSTPVRISETLKNQFPVKTVKTFLPESLKTKLPSAPTSVVFTPATPSGSFAKSDALKTALSTSDFAILAGDLSKNAVTAIALAEALKTTDTPVLLIRDSIDLLAPEMNELIDRPNLHLLASVVQLQKLFRATYYPRVILLSEPLLPILETLHKFTLSYPHLTLTTFHQNQIITATSGKIVTTPLTATDYSPLSLWSGTLATKITAFNLWNPKRPLEATAAAVIAH